MITQKKLTLLLVWNWYKTQIKLKQCFKISFRLNFVLFNTCELLNMKTSYIFPHAIYNRILIVWIHTMIFKNNSLARSLIPKLNLDLKKSNSEYFICGKNKKGLFIITCNDIWKLNRYQNMKLKPLQKQGNRFKNTS